MAEEIRRLDRQRLSESLLNQEAPSDEDLAFGRQLLQDNAPEVIAAALVRLHQSRLPEPEELLDDAGARDSQPRQRPERQREPRSPEMGGGVWFRLPVGRQQKADPKWLIPLICRQGHVTKKDIGEIRILDRETRFEIAPDAEGKFRAAIRKVVDAGMRIDPVEAPGPRPPRPPRPDGPRPDGPRPDGPRPDKPRADNARPDRPRPDKPRPDNSGGPRRGPPPKRRKANG